MLDKTKLIKDLLSLVEEEQKYKKEYDKEYQRIYQDGKNEIIAGWEREKFQSMRTPNNANIKDALKIISRLSMQQSKE